MCAVPSLDDDAAETSAAGGGRQRLVGRSVCIPSLDGVSIIVVVDRAAAVASSHRGVGGGSYSTSYRTCPFDERLRRIIRDDDGRIHNGQRAFVHSQNLRGERYQSHPGRVEPRRLLVLEAELRWNVLPSLLLSLLLDAIDVLRRRSTALYDDTRADPDADEAAAFHQIIHRAVPSSGPVPKRAIAHPDLTQLGIILGGVF